MSGAEQSTHECPVAGCALQVRQRWLMCPEHWGMVPRRLANAVYNAYHAGAVREHAVVCREAVAAVEAALGNER